MGAWIEIRNATSRKKRGFVAPLVGAWIEITNKIYSGCIYKSLLSWERGLKSCICVGRCVLTVVAPLVGAWIEISDKDKLGSTVTVAPLVGAWIEIFRPHSGKLLRAVVAPLVGAWIEIQKRAKNVAANESLLSWERGLK